VPSTCLLAHLILLPSTTTHNATTANSPYRAPPSPAAALVPSTPSSPKATSNRGTISNAPGSPSATTRPKQLGQAFSFHRSGTNGSAPRTPPSPTNGLEAGRYSPGSLQQALAAGEVLGVSRASAAAAAAAVAYRSVRYTPAGATIGRSSSSSSKPSTPHKRVSGHADDHHHQQQQAQRAPSGQLSASGLQLHVPDSSYGSVLSMHTATSGFHPGSGSTSSTSVRPSTARGGSRAKLHTPPPDCVGRTQQPGVSLDLDVQSWSAFLHVDSPTATTAAAAAAAEERRRAAPDNAAAVAAEAYAVTSARSMSAAAQQMLRDLGLGSQSRTATSPPQRPASAGGSRPLEPTQQGRSYGSSSGGGGSSILDQPPQALAANAGTGPLSSSLRRSRTIESAAIAATAGLAASSAAAPVSSCQAALSSSSVQRRSSSSLAGAASQEFVNLPSGPLHAGLAHQRPPSPQRQQQQAWQESVAAAAANHSSRNASCAGNVETPARRQQQLHSPGVSSALNAAAPATVSSSTPTTATAGAAATAHQLLRFVQTPSGGLRRWSAADSPVLAAASSPARTARSDGGPSPASGLQRRGSGEGSSLAGGDTRGTLTAMRGSNAWTHTGTESSADMSVGSSLGGAADLTPGSPAASSSASTSAANLAVTDAVPPVTAAANASSAGGVGPSPLGGASAARMSSGAGFSAHRESAETAAVARTLSFAAASAGQQKVASDGAASNMSIIQQQRLQQQQQQQEQRTWMSEGGPKAAASAAAQQPMKERVSEPSASRFALADAPAPASHAAGSSTTASSANSAGSSRRSTTEAVPAALPSPVPATAAATPPAPAAATTATAGTAAADISAADSAVDASYAGLLPGYSVGRVVGEGGFCQVRLGVHHLSRRKVAVKVIDKSKLSDANEAKRIQREIRVLKRLGAHECVIKLFEVIDAGGKLHLVMEYASGGSLLDYVRSRKRLGEAEAGYMLQQIVAGLMYCHDNEVRFGGWVVACCVKSGVCLQQHA